MMSVNHKTGNSPSKNSGHHELPSVLSLTEARDLHRRMIELLFGDRIELDANRVARISTPCLQVLLAAGVAADAANANFKIHNATDTFVDALDESGLRSQFANWIA